MSQVAPLFNTSKAKQSLNSPYQYRLGMHSGWLRVSTFQLFSVIPVFVFFFMLLLPRGFQPLNA